MDTGEKIEYMHHLARMLSDGNLDERQTCQIANELEDMGLTAADIFRMIHNLRHQNERSGVPEPTE